MMSTVIKSTHWVFLFFTLSYTQVFAQGLNENAVAANLIPKPKHCVFTGIFNQSKTIAGLDEPLASNGVFLHHCLHGIIWKTLSPIEEGLVVDAKQNAYQIVSGETKKLQARAGRMIAQIIQSLMSGDNDFVQSNFSVEVVKESLVNEANESSVIKSAAKRVRLTPENRQLKRALDSITLTSPSESNPQGSIEIIDKRTQKTIIIVTEKASFAQTTDVSECVEQIGFNETECRLLFHSNDVK
jgi:hypothetical protein